MALSAEDVLAIKNLMVRYTQLVDLDSAPEEEFLSLFTEDAVIISPQRGRFEGRAGQRVYAEGARRSRGAVLANGIRPALIRRCLSNFLVEGDDDTATMRVYVINFLTELQTAPRRSEFKSCGHYECELRKLDGAWRMSRRVMVMDNVNGGPNDKSHLDHSEIPTVLVPA